MRETALPKPASDTDIAAAFWRAQWGRGAQATGERRGGGSVRRELEEAGFDWEMTGARLRVRG